MLMVASHPFVAMKRDVVSLYGCIHEMIPSAQYHWTRVEFLNMKKSQYQYKICPDTRYAVHRKGWVQIILTSSLKSKSSSVCKDLPLLPLSSRGSAGGGHLRQEYSRAQGESQSTTTAQLHSQLQQHFTELAAKIPLHDLLGRVRNLGFPSSCTFVLNMLERYMYIDGKRVAYYRALCNSIFVKPQIY